MFLFLFNMISTHLKASSGPFCRGQAFDIAPKTLEFSPTVNGSYADKAAVLFSSRSGRKPFSIYLLFNNIWQLPTAFEPAFGRAVEPKQQEEVLAGRDPVAFHAFGRLWRKKDIC